MGLTTEQVVAKVRDVLVDALGADEEEVVPGARLVADLGAESIDFLDIVFRLEKAFGIKIEQGELIPDGVLNDPRFVEEGRVTDLGMAELRRRLPHADLEDFAASRRVEEFPDIFTMDTVVKFVVAKLAASGGAAAPA